MNITAYDYTIAQCALNSVSDHLRCCSSCKVYDMPDIRNKSLSDVILILTRLKYNLDSYYHKYPKCKNWIHRRVHCDRMVGARKICDGVIADLRLNQKTQIGHKSTPIHNNCLNVCKYNWTTFEKICVLVICALVIKLCV
jgi:hypothetical protein